MFCIFQNSALQFTHPTSKTALFSACHSFPYNILRLMKPKTVGNGIFYYTCFMEPTGASWLFWLIQHSVPEALDGRKC